MKHHYRGYSFEHDITDDGKSIVVCTRPGAGICGIGRSDEEAMQDFRDKEEELLPLPLGRMVNLGNPESPPERIDEPNSRYED